MVLTDKQRGTPKTPNNQYIYGILGIGIFDQIVYEKSVFIPGGSGATHLNAVTLFCPCQ
jgi:hypothetical protein